MEQFYEQHHKEYFESTVGIDPSRFLTPLTQFLKPGAAILDIGCGSGRDLLWLREHGFQATGFEQSRSLAALAREHASCPVIEGDYNAFDFSTLHFDGLVLVGALVHQPQSKMKSLLCSIRLALQESGYMLVTMKEGEGVSSSTDGRTFVLWGKEEIEDLYRQCGLTIVDFSRQVSKIRAEDTWLGHVLRLDHGS